MAERTPLNIATQGNEVWSIDFISDSLANGWRLKCMAAADDFSHACVGIAVDYGISDMYMTRRLDRAARFRDYPASVRTDYGTEFTSRYFPEAGRPMQKGYIESFNGKFRDECLNDNWFRKLRQARNRNQA